MQSFWAISLYLSCDRELYLSPGAQLRPALTGAYAALTAALTLARAFPTLCPTSFLSQSLSLPPGEPVAQLNGSRHGAKKSLRHLGHNVQHTQHNIMWRRSRATLPGLLLITLIMDVQSDSQVSQDPYLLATENKDVTLKCAHKMPNYDILIWYKHIPGRGLEVCAHGVSTVSNFIPRYSMTMDRAALTTELHITGVTGEDTAVYYCAGRDTLTLTHGSSVQESACQYH
ncbi:unnamed protein product [Ranitomeya imitator]|uniref:Ig-like domain-containing protein n=1 Tax=Ranitomeya imitator TaxID=111125 RepID=A0ABN9KZC8_9NEOB|nr:unnamed protein product [Ranitomeya imitator]